MFCADIISPLVKRVMRALGIEGKTSHTPMIAEMTVEVAAGAERTTIAGLGNYPWATEGSKVRVIWDGVAYDCEMVAYHPNNPNVFAGNVAKATGKGDTGEPFCIGVRSDTGTGSIYDFGDTTVTRTHTLEVQNLVKTTTPIDPKYLPEGFGGGGLPVVELSTTISFEATEPQALSTEDGTLIDAVVTKRNPFILALDTGEFAVSAVFNVSYIKAASMYVLSAFFETMRFELIKESGVWYFICYAQG